jgi:dipeptidyl-peptidase 4
MDLSMLRARLLALPIALALTAPLGAQYKPKYTVEQFLSPPFPLVFASARKADRIAWVGYDRGKRNVYTAAAPNFSPVKLTAFDKDDGQDITAVDVSDDGSTIVFVRGSNPNNRGWVANPAHDPDGSVRAIWAVGSGGGAPAVKLVDSVAAPQVSPDGKQILYVKDGQIYRARFPMPAAPTSMDKGDVPFIKEWGCRARPAGLRTDRRSR